MNDRLTPADMSGIRGNLAQLKDRPIVNSRHTLRGNLLLARGERDIYKQAFNVRDFHG